MNQEDQIIRDPSDLRKYRIELPNLYDDAGLDVYEFRLLAHYKRVGRCTESTSTTAEKCGMSAGKVSETRKSLADKKFIKMLKIAIPEGFSYVIEVVDKWPENFRKYAKATPSPRERYPSPHEGTPSPGETKKEPIKNISSSSTGGRIFEIYEQEIGALTPLVRDAIVEAEQTYPPDWLPEAIGIAAASNKRSWKYVEGILKNCKAKNIRPSLSNAEVKQNGKNRQSAASSPKADPIRIESDSAHLAEINRRRRERHGAGQKTGPASLQ
jgi:DnaD/phage-associated family protein